MGRGQSVAAQIAALKAEAVALREAGDKVGAVQKVREMKALQAEAPAAEPDGNVASQAAADKAAEVKAAEQKAV